MVVDAVVVAVAVFVFSIVALFVVCHGQGQKLSKTEKRTCTSHFIQF